MKRLKGILFGIVCSLAALCGLCFVGCGKTYDGIEISVDKSEINFRMGYADGNVQEAEVSATISGVKNNNISKKLEFISSSTEVVRVDSAAYANDVTTAKLVAVGGGDATIYVISEGKAAKEIAVHVDQEASAVSIDANYTPVILKGNGFVFDLSKVILSPASCTDKEVLVELWQGSPDSPIKQVFADAKVLSIDQVAKLETEYTYFFKVIKKSTEGTANIVQTTKAVRVRNALNGDSISLVDLATEQGLEKFNLSTNNLGDETLKPSLISAVVGYTSYQYSANGTNWSTLTEAGDGNATHYKLVSGISINYFVIDSANDYYYITNSTYSLVGQRLTLVGSKTGANSYSLFVDNKTDLTGLSVKVSGSSTSFSVSDLHQVGEIRYFDVNALAGGSGEITVTVFYEGFEASAVSRTFNVSVVEYPRVVDVYANGNLVSNGAFNFYNGKDNVLKFVAAPAIDGITTKMRLEMRSAAYNNFESISVSFDDINKYYMSNNTFTEVIAALTFVTEKTGAAANSIYYNAETDKYEYTADGTNWVALTKVSTDETNTHFTYTNEVEKITYFVVGESWKASAEFISDTAITFTLKNNVASRSTEDIVVYISSATGLFSEKEVATKTLTATNTIAIESVTLKYSETEISTSDGKPTSINVTYGDGLIGNFELDVVVGPEGADLSSLQFTISGAGYGYFDRTRSKLVITPTGVGKVTITATADLFKETKFYYAELYTVASKAEADFVNAQTSGNAIVDGNKIYVTNSSKDIITLPIDFGVLYAENCTTLDRVGANAAVNGKFIVGGISFEYLNGVVKISSSANVGDPGNVKSFTLTFKNKFDENETQTISSLTIVIYNKMDSQNVKFFDANENGNALSVINLDYLGSVGIYGNSTKTFYLGNKYDEFTNYTFRINGSEVSDGKIITRYGVLEINSDREVTFTANGWEDNGRDVAYIELIGTEEQFGKTYSTSVVIAIHNRTKTQNVSLTNVGSSKYVSQSLSNFEISSIVSPTNAFNKKLIYVVTNSAGEVLGTTAKNNQGVYPDISIPGLTLLTDGVLKVTSAGDWNIYVVAEDSISEKIEGTFNPSNYVCAGFSLIFADGSQDHPYLISNVNELESLKNGEYFASENYFKITSDIDCKEENLALGSLTGHIDGAGHKIYNFKVTGANGLFSTISGSIKNLTLCDAQVAYSGTIVNAGVLAGKITGSAENISIYNVSVDFALGTVTNFGTVAGSATFNCTNAEKTIIYIVVDEENQKYFIAKDGSFAEEGSVPLYVVPSKNGAIYGSENSFEWFNESAWVALTQQTTHYTYFDGINTRYFLIDGANGRYVETGSTYNSVLNAFTLVSSKEDLLFIDNSTSTYKWFNGSEWLTLTQDSEDATHYTYTEGTITTYFVIDPENEKFVVTEIDFETIISTLVVVQTDSDNLVYNNGSSYEIFNGTDWATLTQQTTHYTYSDGINTTNFVIDSANDRYFISDSSYATETQTLTRLSEKSTNLIFVNNAKFEWFNGYSWATLTQQTTHYTYFDGINTRYFLIDGANGRYVETDSTYNSVLNAFTLVSSKEDLLLIDNSTFKWFNGSEWLTLTQDSEDATHYTYSDGINTTYFVIDGANDRYFISDSSYTAETQTLTRLSEKSTNLIFVNNAKFEWFNGYSWAELTAAEDESSHFTYTHYELNFNVYNITISGTASNMAGVFEKVSGDEDIRLEGLYIGDLSAVISRNGNVKNNIDISGGFVDAEVEITKTDDVLEKQATKEDGTTITKLVYYVDAGVWFSADDLFTVTSTAKDKDDPSKIFYNIGSTPTYTDGILQKNEKGMFRIAKFGECTFTETSDVDSTVSASITICFLPKTVKLTNSEDIFMNVNANVNVEPNIDKINDFYRANIEFSSEVTGNVKYEFNVVSFAYKTKTDGGEITLICYFIFEDGSKLELARKTITVTMDTSATAISGSISNSSLTPGETAVLTVVVDTMEAVSIKGLEGEDGVEFVKISESRVDTATGKQTFIYRVYVNQNNVSYGENTFTISPSSNGQVEFELNVTVVRPSISDVTIDHFSNDNSSSETGIYAGKTIDNAFININEESLFSFYLNPKVADVQTVRILSNYLSLQVYDKDNSAVPLTPISGGVRIDVNPFKDGLVFVKSTLGNIAAGVEVWVRIEVDYNVDKNESTETKTFLKTITLTSKERVDLEIIAPERVSELTEFEISFAFNGNVLYGELFNKALANLNLGSHFNIIRTIPEEGKVVLASAGNALGPNTIETSFEEVVAGVTRKYSAEAQIKVVDVIITGVDFVINYGKTDEEVVDDILTLTAYNSFSLGFRLKGSWASSYNSIIASLEDYLNNFDKTNKNGTSTIFFDAEDNALERGKQNNYFEIMNALKEISTISGNVIKLLNILPIRPVSSTGIKVKLAIGYDADGQILIKVGDKYINKNRVTTDYGNSSENVEQIQSISIQANSSEDCPIPISSGEELIANNVAGANLILTNDITLESWDPIQANFATLDGNSYKIILKENAFQSYLSAINSDKIKSGTLNIGIFSSLPAGSIIKNLFVAVSAQNQSTSSTTATALNVRFNYVAENKNALTINFGTLVAENSGIITNCHLVYVDTPQSSSTSPTDDIMFLANINRGSYTEKSITGSIGAFVGINRGTVTHSSNMVDLCVGQRSTSEAGKTIGDYNIAGLVADNIGVIASCYVSSASIYGHGENMPNINKPSGSEKGPGSLVAGFVAYNGDAGNITYSYVFGGYNPSKWDSTSTLENVLRSNYKTVEARLSGVSAFNNINMGRISNSYANITCGTSGSVSGFIYENGPKGIVQTCYTLSQIYRNFASYPFMYNNQGTVLNCYSLKSSIGDAVATALTTDEFTKESSFVGFGFQTQYNKNDTDWSFDSDAVIYFQKNTATADNVYAVYVGAGRGSYFGQEQSGKWTFYFVGEGNGTYNISEEEIPGSHVFNAIKYSSGMPRIVSADTVTSSRRVLVGAVDVNGNPVSVDEISTRAIRYYYYRFIGENETQESGEKFFDLGTKNNPILITNLSEFKALLINGASTYGKFGNDYYYRLISSLDFKEELTAPSTTTSTFYGFLDGNGMTLNNFRINVGLGSNGDAAAINEALGLFGIIDGTAGIKVPGVIERTKAGAGVKGLTINITEFYANTYVYVGGLAGVVNNGYIYNVAINSETNVIAYGRNIIGGAIGLAVGNSDIYNITTNISVFSTYVQKESRWDEYNKHEGSLDGSFNELQMKSETYSSKESDGFTRKLSYLADAKTSYAGSVIGVLDLFYKDSNNKLNQVVSETLVSRPTAGTFIVKAARVGGIVGYIGRYSILNDAKIDLIGVSSMNISSSDVAGGLVGENRGTLRNSGIINYTSKLSNGVYQNEISTMFDKSTGKIIGGVVGINIDGIIDSCSLMDYKEFIDLINKVKTLELVSVANLINVKISNKYAIYLGGVAGVSTSKQGGFVSKITNCYNVADLEASMNDSYVGGIVGFLGSATTETNELSSCFNVGKITATSESKTNIGGLVGRAYRGAKISSSFNVGTISSNCNTAYIGGLVGNSDNIEIVDSFVSANINNNNNSDNGNKAGFVGASESSGKTLNISNCYVIAKSDVVSNLNLIYGNGITIGDNSVYTVAAYLQSDLQSDNRQGAQDKTFVELYRLLHVNEKESGVWFVDNGWAPINNVENLNDFRTLILASNSPFVKEDGQNQITSSTNRFSGSNTYVLTSDVTLNGEIDATGWTGVLIGNGFTIKVKSGHSVFKENTLTGGTLFNFNIEVESAEGYTSLGENFGLVCASITDAKTINVFDVKTVHGVTLTGSAQSKAIGGFIGKIAHSENNEALSTVNFIGCTNAVDISSSASSVKLGGFIGDADSSTSLNFTYCINTGTISAKNDGVATTDSKVGGFVGDPLSITIDQCISAGALTGSTVNAFVGEGTSTITNSIAAANGASMDSGATTSYQLSENNNYSITYYGTSGGEGTSVTWPELYETLASQDSNVWDVNFPFVMFSTFNSLQNAISGTNSALKLETTKISTEEQLLSISDNGWYELTDDITLTHEIPNTFNGYLLGNGHTITLNGIGYMFADDKLSSATISDLTINGGGLVREITTENTKLTITDVNLVDTAYPMIGGAGGDSGSNINITISGCIVSGYITNGTYVLSAEVNRNATGSLVGEFSSSGGKLIINNCINTATIEGYWDKTEKIRQVGGFVGKVINSKNNTRCSVEINSCVNLGKICGNYTATGGIIGGVYGRHGNEATVDVKNCISAGVIYVEARNSGSIVARGAGIGGALNNKAILNIINCIDANIYEKDGEAYGLGNKLGRTDKSPEANYTGTVNITNSYSLYEKLLIAFSSNFTGTYTSLTEATLNAAKNALSSDEWNTENLFPFPKSAVSSYSELKKLAKATDSVIAEEFNEISNQAELLSISGNNVYVITADITLTKQIENAFSGTLLGGSHKITLSNGVGYLFALESLCSATISDLTIEGGGLSHSLGKKKDGSIEDTNINLIVKNVSIVTAGKYLIWDCLSNNAEITLDSCSVNLTGVTFPDSQTSSANFGGFFKSFTNGECVIKNYAGRGGVVLDESFGNFKNLKSITFASSVTSINTRAFQYCTGLASVTFANNSQLNSISSSAFYGCSSLKSVNIPSSVTVIREHAFSGCSGLTSVTIPSSVTVIREHAFSGCSGLTSITIPSSVTSIGNYAFSSCQAIESIEVDANNTIFKSVNNCILSKEGKILYVACKNSTIPDDVTTIATGAFRGCAELTSITIPASVTSIGDYAFDGCTGLTSITIPSSVTSIGSYAFYNCSKLNSVTFNNVNGWKVGSITISGTTLVAPLEAATYLKDTYASNAWTRDDANYLTFTLSGSSYSVKATNVSTIGGNVIIPSTYNGKNVTAVESNGFQGAGNMTSVTIPSSVTSIGSDAFYGCSGLTSVTIPNGVKEIGMYAFSDCSSLKSVTIPSSVTVIREHAFYGCTGLTSITIPASVTSIGDYAFYGCSSLTSITIPASVTSIGDYAFYGCYALAEVYNLSNLDIVDGKTSNGYVGYYAKVIHTNSSELTRIRVNNGVAYYVYGSDKIALVLVDRTKTQITLDAGTTAINRSAFYNCSGLTSVTIPNGVKEIGMYAFSGCYALAEVYNLSNLNIVTGTTSNGYVGYYAKVIHTNSSEPTRISVKNEVAYYVYGSDKIAIGLVDRTKPQITLDAGTTAINQYAFYNCTGLTSITIPASVTTIGSGAFNGCWELKTVTIDSATIANRLTSNNSLGFLIGYAETVYVKTGLPTSSSTYLTGNFTKQATSDKTGYDKWVKNS